MGKTLTCVDRFDNFSASYEWCGPGIFTPAPTPNRTCKFPSIRLSKHFLASLRTVLLPVTVQTQGPEVVVGARQCKVCKTFHGNKMVHLGTFGRDRLPTPTAPILVPLEGLPFQVRGSVSCPLVEAGKVGFHLIVGLMIHRSRQICAEFRYVKLRSKPTVFQGYFEQSPSNRFT